MKQSLRRQVLFVSLISLLIGVMIFLTCYTLSFSMLHRTVYSHETLDQQADTIYADLQSYITEQQISIENVAQLDQWKPPAPGLVFFRLYQENRLIYTTPLYGYQDENAGLDDLFYSEGFGDIYDLKLADQTSVSMSLTCTNNRVYYLAFLISVLAGIVGFSVSLYTFLRKKILYIETVRKELDILAGGQLEYDVTVTGIDELSGLADGINQMKDTIIRRQEAEETARKANNDLITSMAHDLRSPLTSLIGYLEILTNRKYKTEEQASRYTAQSLKKAFQIKGMSDQLFEYFLVYSADREEQAMEPLPAESFFTEALNDFTWSLENSGFQVIREEYPVSGMLKLNPDLMKRIFDNMYSNIAKYADPAEPVSIQCTESEGCILIRVKNRISTDAVIKQGSGIGLATCERIAAFHNGHFLSSRFDGSFQVELYLPLLKRTY